MKLYRFISIAAAMVIAFGAVCAKASDAPSGTNRAKQTYALLCAAGVMNSDPDFDYEAEVSPESFSAVYRMYFGEAPKYTSDKILNCTAVQNLALHYEAPVMPERSITFFKDFGLIDREHRNAYKAMCASGYLNFENEFLQATEPLSYGTYLHLLSFFGSSLAENLSLEFTSGTVAEASSHNNTISILVETESQTVELSFKRNEEFPVYKDSAVTPYSYNIKRGDKACFYSKSGKIIYVSVEDKPAKASTFNPEALNIFTSEIYLYNQAENQMILKNSATGKYVVFGIDSGTLFYKGNEQKSLSEINTLYLDMKCNFISDKETNSIKYIYIE